MKNFLLLTFFTVALSNATIWAQSPSHIKKNTRTPTTRTEPLKPIEPIFESGVPTLARPLEGSLTIRSIDNFAQPALELPKGLTATNINNGLPRWIEGALPTEFKTQKTTEERVFQYISAVGKAMSITNPSEEFDITKTETDDIGQTHVRMRQKLGNVPVYGSAIIAHEVNGVIQRLNGAYFPTPSVKSLIPTLSATTANDNVRTALSQTKTFTNLTEDQKQYIGGEQLRNSLVIYHKNDDPTAERLAYHVIAYPNVLHRYEYFVDAENGAILYSFSASCSIAGHRHEEELDIKDGDLKFEKAQNTEGANELKIKNSELKIKNSELKIKNSELKIKNPELTNEFNINKNEFNPLTRLVVDGKFMATALDLFGVNRTINTYQVGTTYYLLDANRVMFSSTTSRMPSKPVGAIETRDYNYTDNGPFKYVASPNNTWNAALPDLKLMPTAVSAHYNGGIAYDYYKNTFSRSSIDGKGGTITSFINVTDNRQSMDNAYWNGEAMFYGNGGSVFFPLAKGLDVAGHEMTHGVIQNAANLRYDNEPGALNESFADIFGVMIDRDDWQIGEDVIKDRTVFVTGFLRDMANPNNGGTNLNSDGWQPKQVSEKYNGSQDNGGVHINSGITNRAFYLFASNAAVGKIKAEQVYYRALDKYVVASSNFLDCRAAVESSCRDLYPTDATLLSVAQNAFTTVGIGTGGSSTGTVYQQDLQVNPGSDYVVFVSDDRSKLQLLTVATGVVTTLSSRGINNKPSVTDNGKFVYYIGADKKMYAISIGYGTNITFTDNLVQSSPTWNNVAISKDGTKLAGNEGDSLISVYSFPLQQWRYFKLYNPTFSQNVNSNVVKYSDGLEWDHFGEYVLYDAFNSIPSQTGDNLEFWDVGFLKAWSNSARTWAMGQVEKLFTSLPKDTGAGNPTFAKNSPYIVAFDFIDERGATPVYQVKAANIQTGKAGAAPIFTNNTLGYPSFTRTDNRLLISTEASPSVVNKLITIPLAASKIDASSSTATTIQTVAYQGNWFANGVRALATDELDKSAVSISPNPFNNLVSIAIKSDIVADGKVEIFNLLGQSVSKTPLSILSGDNAISVETSDLSAGAYVLKVTVGGKTRATKIVKL